MYALAIESSCALGSVALVEDGNLKAFSSSTNQRAHSEFLNPAIEECLQKSGLSLSQVDVFACGQGPGSFTGIRVAANIAKSFAYFYAKPLVTCDSFDKLSQQNLSLESQIYILNAYKNMVYTCFYRDGKRVLDPCALTIPGLEKTVRDIFPGSDPLPIFGDGYLAYQNHFSPDLRSRFFQKQGGSHFPSAQSLGLLACLRKDNDQTIEWNNFLPLYIRASEAEENLRVK